MKVIPCMISSMIMLPLLVREPNWFVAYTVNSFVPYVAKICDTLVSTYTSSSVVPSPHSQVYVIFVPREEGFELSLQKKLRKKLSPTNYAQKIKSIDGFT